MRALLDINVLIALLDAAHLHHARARQWISDNIGGGWASCALTQNGVVRIMSQPSYPNAMPTARAIEAMARACATEHHQFWVCDLSLLTAEQFDRSRIHGPKQLTDLYLLALAVRHGGRFVTFDGAIAINAVVGASVRHLAVL